MYERFPPFHKSLNRADGADVFGKLTVGAMALSIEPSALSWSAASRQMHPLCLRHLPRRGRQVQAAQPEGLNSLASNLNSFPEARSPNAVDSNRQYRKSGRIAPTAFSFLISYVSRKGRRTRPVHRNGSCGPAVSLHILRQ